MFVWRYYLATNSDIRDAGITTEEQAIQHWFTHGQIEKRCGWAPIEYYKSSPNPREEWLGCEPVQHTTFLIIVNATVDTKLKIDCLLNNIPYFKRLGKVIVKGEIKIPYRRTELSQILKESDPINVYEGKTDNVIVTDDSYYIIRPLDVMIQHKTNVVKAILQGQEFVPVAQLTTELEELFLLLGIPMPPSLSGSAVTAATG
jgi:hypothetical protein